MMRFLITLAVFTAFTTPLFSQSKLFLNGVIGIQGGELYSYDMDLTPTAKAHEYKGTVKTYALIDKEVIAEVILTVDLQAMTARLKETKIINNKGFQSNATICLVDAQLTYEPKNGVLKGPIITQTSGDAAYCAIGNVTFTSTNAIHSLFNISTTTEPVIVTTPTKAPISTPQQAPKKVTENIVSPITTYSEPTSVAPTIKKLKEVTEGQDAEIAWHSDKITMEIWDDNKIDGDRVSVLYNGKEILTNHLLNSTPKVLEFDISGSELNIITIIAMSEGSEPPNTAMIQLKDKDREPHKILSHNVAGKKSLIRIRRKL